MVEELPKLEHLEGFVKDDAIKELLRQTERRIDDQLRLATAADQRAVAFAAVLIVVVGVFVGNQANSEFDWAGAWILVSLLVSIVLAIYSAKPTRVYGSGSSAKSLSEYSSDQNVGFLLSGIIERNDANIQDNDKALKHSAFAFRISLFFAALAGIFVLLDWLDVPSLKSLVCNGE